MPTRIAHLVLTLNPRGGLHQEMLCYEATVTSLAPEECGHEGYQLHVVLFSEQAATHEEAVAAVRRTLRERALSNDSYKLVESYLPKETD